MKLSLERVYAEGLAEAFADLAGLSEQLRFGNRAEVPGHCERSAAVHPSSHTLGGSIVGARLRAIKSGYRPQAGSYVRLLWL